MTEAKDKKTTLLSYLVHSVCADQAAPLLDFGQEMPSLNYAARISLSSVEEELGLLESASASLATQVTAAKQQGDAMFAERFGAFVRQAQESCRDERVEVDAMRRAFAETVTFFGDDASEMASSEQFFDLIRGEYWTGGCGGMPLVSLVHTHSHGTGFRDALKQEQSK